MAIHQPPPDYMVIETLMRRMYTNDWMRKSSLHRAVNQTNWPDMNYRYPSWYQLKRCLSKMCEDGRAEYRYHVKGWFKTRQWRKVNPKQG